MKKSKKNEKNMKFLLRKRFQWIIIIMTIHTGKGFDYDEEQAFWSAQAQDANGHCS